MLTFSSKLDHINQFQREKFEEFTLRCKILASNTENKKSYFIIVSKK